MLNYLGDHTCPSLMAPYKPSIDSSSDDLSCQVAVSSGEGRWFHVRIAQVHGEGLQNPRIRFEGR